ENHHPEPSPSEHQINPSGPEPPASDSSDEDARFEDFLVDSQQPDQPDSSPTNLSQGSETPTPGKNYSWVPAHHPAPNNISSDIDTSNIISGSRRSGHSANAVGYMKEDPRSYNEAIGSIHREEWSKAIVSELGNMDKHEVWTVVTQTKDMNPLSTTWMEDLGLAKYGLGIRIIQEKGSIKLIQDKYIHSILTEFQVYNDRDTAIPLPNNYNTLKFTPSESPDKPPFNYRRVVGLLRYVVQCTRPDLAFAVSFLSQFLEDPKLSHYQAARHALRYLCHTKSKVLILGQNDLGRQSHELVRYSDSDWNGSKAWNSYAGSVIYYNGTIGWRSHKQDVVALSSAEGEYVALTE
ncbi:hypothetical protein MJO28_015894, partial [Puccinia striiformis f. sp. tritici]